MHVRSRRGSPGSGLELVDGSISGGPPRLDGSTRVYLSGSPGARAEHAPSTPTSGRGPSRRNRGRDRVGGEDVDRVGLQGHGRPPCPRAPRRACERRPLVRAGRPARLLSRSSSSARPTARWAETATKAERYVGEMREIAATQEAARIAARALRRLRRLYAALLPQRELASANAGVDRVRTGSFEDVLVALAPAR